LHFSIFVSTKTVSLKQFFSQIIKIIEVYNMKRDFTLLMAAFVLAVCMMMPLGVMGQTETSKLTLSSTKKFGTSSGSTLQTETTPLITWTVTKTSGSGEIQNSYQSAYHGQQFGTGNAPWGGTFSASYGNTVSSVKVDANTGGSATLSVTVGGVSFTCGNNTTVDVEKNSSSSGPNYYEFTGEGTGAVVISLTGTSKACYFGGVVVTSIPAIYTVTLADDNTTLTQSSPGASVTLPSRSDIGAYTFAGWSETNVEDETTTAPTIIPAGAYTPTGDITLYPVYTRTETSSGTTNHTASVTISSYASANGWVNSNRYTTITMDDNVIVTGKDNGNNSKYYSSSPGTWRHYASDNGEITIATTSGTLNSVTFTYSGNTLTNGGNNVTSGTAYAVSGTSAVFAVSGTSSNTQVSAISVSYTIGGGSTNYYWSWPSTGPVINATDPDPLSYNATSGAINYTIDNSVAGTSLTAISNVDWITIVQVSSSQVTFDVSKNTSNEDRNGTITLSYQGASNKTVTITQGHLEVSAPTFDPAGGAFQSPQSVTLSTTESDATIHYTIDGSTPTINSATYSTPIAVSTTTTINAVVVKDEVSSPVASATYTINIPRTITFNAGNGTCDTPSMTGTTGSSITLPTATPSALCATSGWTFAGWATESVSETTTAPTLLSGNYTINGNATLYAVYKLGERNDESFEYVFGEQGYNNAAEVFSDVMDATSGIGWAATTGSNAPAYYDIGSGLRVYNEGTFTITTNNNTIFAVSLTFSGPGYTFNTNDPNPTTWSGDQSSNITWNVTRTCRLQKVDITYGSLTYTYATSPDCTELTVSETSLSFTYEASLGSFDFSVTNPIIDASVSATATESWITNIAISGNTVNFQVTENIGMARSGEITLTYAKNGTALAIATVTVNQDSNPILPGGADNPYTVADALTIIARYEDNQTSDGEVYVTGIVSKIDEIEVVQYHDAKYYISDNGTTDSQLMSYCGRYINNTDFMSEDELLLGDNVVVKGKLKKFHSGSTTTPELDKGNYIVSLDRTVQPVTFNPSSCVTPNGIIVNLFTESLFDWEVVISYTVNGSDPRTYGIEFEDAWDANLELTETTTVKAAAYVPDLDKWSAVTEATYTIVPEGSGGWQGQPYTVAEALAALTPEHSNIKGAYVHGIVSRITQIDTTLYHNATYYISDSGEEEDELYVFRGKYISHADFTSEDQLMVGDAVTVYGDLTIYNGTTKEFKPKNYIEDWYRSASIRITPDQFEFSSNATSGLIHVTYSTDILVNAYNPTVQFCDANGATTTYDWLTVTPSQANDWDLEYIIDANDGDQPRTAYLKVSGQDNQSNVIVSNVISITQSEYKADFATLDFYFNGGHSDVDDTPGLTGSNLATYSNNNTRLKFAIGAGDNQRSILVLKINETPGILTYNIKGNDMQGGTFKVQESSNGITYSDLVSYSGLANNLRSDTIDYLSPSTRYIRWIYETKNKGNVGVGNICLYKPIATYDIVVNQPMIGGTQVATITAPETAFEDATVTLSIDYDANAYYFVEWVVEDASGNPVVVTDNHFTMPDSDVTVTATLVETNTPCVYAFSVNGTLGEQIETNVGDVIAQMPSSDNIVFNGQTFTFRGWTTDPDVVTNLLGAGSLYTMSHDETFYAVYYQHVTGIEAEKHYAKVTRELSDWSGDYLIVYEDEALAFNGGLDPLDGSGNTVPVTISNRIITATETINAAKFTIAAVDGGYSIKSASGKYIGRNANENGLDESGTTAYVNCISYNENEGEIDIVGTGGAYMRFNSASNQNRFRYYNSDSYTGQRSIQLYKYVGGVNNLYTRIFMNETANSVTIEGPSIVPSGSVLEATTITNIWGADRLLVDEGGQLVMSNNVNASVRRIITPYQDQDGCDNYYLVASPVDNLNPVTAGMTDADFDLYAFDQSAQGEEWQNYKANEFATLESGKGYLYANNYGGYIMMSGLMTATADVAAIDHVSGKNYAGWNLIGNPYPCNVTIGNPFYRLAEGGAALATVATDADIAIAPMEGVFVYTATEAEVTFTKAPDVSTTGTGRNMLSLRVSRNRASKDGPIVEDNAIVRFGEGSLLRKLVLNPDNAQLYVAQDGTDYAIVNAEAEGELPVSFRAAENGNYTITANAEGVNFRYLHLIDNKTGADVDLLQTPTYSFEATTADYTSRFRLVFSANSVCEDTDGDAFAFFNGSQWVVSNEGEATLQVVDVLGRVLSSQVINGDAEVSIHEAQGIYLLRLLSGDSVKVQKIINK
jgi:hypothetical protein